MAYDYILIHLFFTILLEFVRYQIQVYQNMYIRFSTLFIMFTSLQNPPTFYRNYNNDKFEQLKTLFKFELFLSLVKNNEFSNEREMSTSRKLSKV